MDWDAIVVGGGHNGLTCAAYLARSARRVLVLEMRPEVGGCSATVNAIGARVNICNCDHVMIRATPIVEELQLERHGLRYLNVDPTQLSLSWSGDRPWFQFHDVDRTLESLRLSYPSEVEGYRRYLSAALPAVDLIIEAANGLPTARRMGRVLVERRGRGVRTVNAWSRTSAIDVLRSFFSSDALISPAATIGPVLWGLPPTLPGTGLGALSYAFRHAVGVGRPAGGSGALAEAIAAAVRASGSEVRVGARVNEILVDDVGVRGVTVADGEVLEAPVVVAACDPRHALLGWLRGAPPRAQRLVARWQHKPTVEGYEAKVDAVIDCLPDYTGVDDRMMCALGVGEARVPTAVIAPSIAGIADAHQTMTRGRVARRPPMLINIPSVLDSSLGPPADSGGHVFSLEALFTPYSFVDGWRDPVEPRRWLHLFADAVGPGFLEGVRRWRAVTPADYESDFGLPRGYAAAFPRSPLSAVVGKDRELTRYRTPVRGLYLTGAATFPGAGVWGASGRNAAAVIMRRD
jgi:phytoene dehydrogenase-like protein